MAISPCQISGYFNLSSQTGTPTKADRAGFPLKAGVATLHLVSQLTSVLLVERSAAAHYPESLGNAYFNKRRNPTHRIALPRLNGQRIERKRPFGLPDPAATENQQQGDGRRKEL